MGSEAGPSEDVKNVNSEWQRKKESLLFPFLLCFGLGGARDMTGSLCRLGNALPLFCDGSHPPDQVGHC